MVIRTFFLVLAALAASLLLVACGSDGTTPATGPTLEAPASGSAALGRQLGSQSLDEPGGDPEEDDESDDDSSDDDSSDDDSSDDDVGGGGVGDGTRVRGLFFGIEPCPATTPECELAVRIKDALVVVTNDSFIENEPALTEGLTPSELEALITGMEGLPMRARGEAVGDAFVANRIRIDDEIRATGIVIADEPGCDVSLLVRGTTPLCFTSGGGLLDPPVGVEATVEGIVPAELAQPYTATEIELADE